MLFFFKQAEYCLKQFGMDYPEVLRAEDVLVLKHPDKRSSAQVIDGQDTLSLLQALQPLVSEEPSLRDHIHAALRSADVLSLFFGSLTRHEVAAIWLLVNTELWSDTFSGCQQALLQNDEDGLAIFLPYLRLVKQGLQKLPVFSGNIWCNVNEDLSDLYTVNSLFSWNGFLRCNIIKRQTMDNSSTTRTILCIHVRSASIIVPVSDRAKNYVPVVIRPYTQFQVTSVSKLTKSICVINLTEVSSPCAFVSLSDFSSQPNAPPSVYWANLVQNFTSTSSVKLFQHMNFIATVTADVQLSFVCLEQLTKYTSFKCSSLEKISLLGEIIDLIERFSVYSNFLEMAFSVANVLYSDPKVAVDQATVESILEFTVEAIISHIGKVQLIYTAIQLLKIVVSNGDEVKQPRKITTSILKAMEYHDKHKEINFEGGMLLEKLFQTSICTSSVTENALQNVILNNVKLHREDLAKSEKCWQLLLFLAGNNNNNKTSQTQTGDSLTKTLQEVLKVFSKSGDIQAEALLTLCSVAESCDTEFGKETELMKSVIDAIRLHSANENVVDCAFKILTKATKNVEQTKFVLGTDGVSCILTAMKHHFDFQCVQEHGFLVLRQLARTGYRCVNTTNNTEQNAQKAIEGLCISGTDYRSLILESGGLDVILSAMKTHNTHIGTKIEGCLAIKTLSVNSENVVESVRPECIDAITSQMSLNADNVTVQTVVFRTLAPLTVNQFNKEIVIKFKIVEQVMKLMKKFHSNAKLQICGVSCLANLSTVTKGALEILANNGVMVMLRVIDAYPEIEPLVTSACSVLANVSSVPKEMLDSNIELHSMTLLYNDGYELAVSCMKRFPTTIPLQLESCRVILSLPVEHASSENCNTTFIVQTFFDCLVQSTDNYDLLKYRSQALNRLIHCFKIPVVMPSGVVEFMLTCVKTFIPEKTVLEESCETLVMATTTATYISQTMLEKKAVPLLFETIRECKQESGIQKMCLRILDQIIPSSLTLAFWDAFSPFKTSQREIITQEMRQINALETLLEILLLHMEEEVFVELIRSLVRLCCNDYVFNESEYKLLKQVEYRAKEIGMENDVNVQAIVSMLSASAYFS